MKATIEAGQLKGLVAENCSTHKQTQLKVQLDGDLTPPDPDPQLVATP